MSEKLKIGILIWRGNQKLTFDMGFKKIENCFKNFNVLNHQRAKVAQNRNFHEMTSILS